MNETCKKNEYLEIQPEILELAEKLLSKEQIEKANRIAEQLANPSTRNQARRELKELMKFGPKRPMYYVQHEIDGLPKWTRNTVKYLGDYVDHLAKFYSAEVHNNKNNEKKSLGINIHKLKTTLPSDFAWILEQYNYSFYVPAKHDMKVVRRSHRFTCKEVVYACFITKRISEIMVNMSDAAKRFSEGMML